MYEDLTPSSKSLSRTLGPADWERFFKYSNYVRQLGATRPSDRAAVITTDTLLTLAALRPSPRLLPRLLTFIFDGSWLTQADLPIVLTCIGPSSRRIRIAKWSSDGGSVSKILSPCLSIVFERFLALQSFTLVVSQGLSWSSINALAPSSIASLPQRLPALTHFECRWIYIEQEAIRALGASQTSEPSPCAS